jgi:ubiquinone biosynthesis protein UbiJ
VKVEKEDLLNDKIRQLHTAQEVIADKEAQVDRVKKELDKLNKRLTDMEQRNDELDIKKRSIEKQ